MRSVEHSYANLVERTRRLFAQTYRLARLACPKYPLLLIQFTAELKRFVAKTDRIHAEECTDLCCPVWEIDDQLRELRRLLATDREPDLKETILDTLATYEARQTVAAHLGSDAVVTIVAAPNQRFRWRYVWRGVTELSEETFATRREAEQNLVQHLRG
jgi:hypothetical protein